jgi:uncharacterized protein (TIGR02391 family)
MAKSKAQPTTTPLADEDLEVAIRRLKRRLEEVSEIQDPAHPGDALIENAARNIVSDLRDVFGADSIEFTQNEHFEIWKGSFRLDMSRSEQAAGVRAGLEYARVLLSSLIARLEERRSEREINPTLKIREAFNQLDLHPRIASASVELYRDGHYQNAVLNAGIALANYVQKKSARGDLDGANLMHTVFSKNNPVLKFNDESEKTDQDEQEGLMHLFVGAHQALRNPRAHTLEPDSPEEALEAIALFSFLAKRLDRAKRVKSP